MRSNHYFSISALRIICACTVLVSLCGTIEEASAGKKAKDKNSSKSKEKMYKKLTDEEKRVIVHKGTERPFSGKYYNHFAEGLYTCKRCGKGLFGSSSKFRSDCG